MRVALFCHSLLSDWNHGNAHFLRGVVTELEERGVAVDVYEPEDAWSVQNLVAEHGTAPLYEVRRVYPRLRCHRYRPATLDLDRALDGVRLAIVHEWNPPELVRRIGRHRAVHGGYRLLFHDTHHRSASAPASMAAYDLDAYDAVLAFGRVVKERYQQLGWASRAYVWHEAADTRVFQPLAPPVAEAERDDLVFIGNWGDDERTAELTTYLLEPARRLRLHGRVHGVRYPEAAREALGRAGLLHGGWLPNYRVPEAYARARVTVHVPRRFYVDQLPGIPTIRPFEALACGIPLVCAPWEDVEGLFEPGRDFLWPGARPR